jgi:hypothetical protein
VNKREVDDWIELILPQCQLMLQLLVLDAELLLCENWTRKAEEQMGATPDPETSHHIMSSMSSHRAKVQKIVNLR